MISRSIKSIIRACSAEFGGRFDSEIFMFGVTFRVDSKFGTIERGGKFTLVADEHDLTDKARGVDHLFDRRRRDVFAAGSFEKLFFAVGDF